MSGQKSGMYGEMPTVKIGRFTIAQMSDAKGCKQVWIQDGEEEGGEFHCDKLEPVIEKFFNENF